ncbi:MAG: FecR family protein [Cyanobacteria bacterium P01_F01_bin.150]
MKPHLWPVASAFTASKHRNSSIDSELGSSSQVVQADTAIDKTKSLLKDGDRFWTPVRQMGLLAWLLGSAVAFPLLASVVQSYTLPVRVDRWLEVRSIDGVVNFHRNNQVQAANYDTRLEQVGDRITTDNDSSATLAVDTGIGFVSLAENTDLHVQEFSITDSGGRVTRLNIVTGQARLQVRPFLNPESELEIRTPAGVSGVRGTQFGVGVAPNGQTGIATTEGQVYAFAQGVTVSINPGFQSLIVPGQPPTPPMPITDNVEIDITRFHPIDRNLVRVAGRIDPFSLLTVNDEIQDVNSEGWFNILVPRPGNDLIPVTVSTLSGKSKDYELAVP